MPAAVRTRPDLTTVLTRATLAAAERLHLRQRDLAAILGISEASVSRLQHGTGRVVHPESKEGELALLFLRAWRSLDAMVGGDDRAARVWFHADNLHLGGTPAQLVRSAEGLVRVVQYLDAMRGRL